MFPFLRFSAVMTSIIVASTGFGFGLATALFSTDIKAEISFDSSRGFTVSAAERHEELHVGTIRRMRSIAVSYQGFDRVNAPAVNMFGPLPGVEHTNMGRSRGIAPASLMAMN